MKVARNQAVTKRKTVGYDYPFLNCYRPNNSGYLSVSERKHLQTIGTPKIAQQPAGTYAKHILNRLLIDLSWNSSRLEGNTYSLLDSRRLIDFGQAAEGHKPIEAQMILNHKDAIEFLVGNAEDIGFNRYTVLNLHAQLPYLQPFDDVNKRVSRLAANIPLIKHNLCPLSFVDVPNTNYIEAVMGIYELNDTTLLKEVFIWAYERSAERYAAVRQSLGEPDPLRLRYRDALKTIVSLVINEKLSRNDALTKVIDWTQEEIEAVDQDAFQAMVEEELLSLHEGNFARYAVRPSVFEAWQNIW